MVFREPSWASGPWARNGKFQVADRQAGCIRVFTPGELTIEGQACKISRCHHVHGVLDAHPDANQVCAEPTKNSRIDQPIPIAQPLPWPRLGLWSHF